MSAPLLIADSGPLIALARLDLLSLPARYFSEVLITATVWEEVSRNAPGEEGARLHEAVDASLFQLVADPALDPNRLPDVLQGNGIDLGELSVIVLGRTMGAVVLIDDLRARRAAQALALPMLGTIGLLVRAREQGLITALRPLLERLTATGYFLPADLVSRLLNEFRE